MLYANSLYKENEELTENHWHLTILRSLTPHVSIFIRLVSNVLKWKSITHHKHSFFNISLNFYIDQTPVWTTQVRLLANPFSIVQATHVSSITLH